MPLLTTCKLPALRAEVAVGALLAAVLLYPAAVSSKMIGASYEADFAVGKKEVLQEGQTKPWTSGQLQAAGCNPPAFML